MKASNLFLSVCVIVLSAVIMCGTAESANLFGHGYYGDDSLYMIDPVAQTVTLVGVAAEERYGPDIQFDPSANTIYMSQTAWEEGEEDTVVGNLLLIDPSTGLNVDSLALSGFPESAHTPTALEFVGSTLYGSFHESGPESGDGILATINTSTGSIIEIGAMTGMNRPAGGLSYVGGIMYTVSATDNNDSALFSINLGTGAATLIGNLTLDGMQKEAATALAYTNGKMYTVLNDESTFLYSIDLGTGVLTEEFDMGVDMNSLTVVPEPISSTLFIIGGAVLGFRRFRKNILK